VHQLQLILDSGLIQIKEHGRAAVSSEGVRLKKVQIHHLRLPLGVLPGNLFCWHHGHPTEAGYRVVASLPYELRKEPRKEHIRPFGNIQFGKSLFCGQHLVWDELEIKNGLLRQERYDREIDCFVSWVLINGCRTFSCQRQRDHLGAAILLIESNPDALLVLPRGVL
jgi:hypothetical protein